jgi:hypothetical protein
LDGLVDQLPLLATKLPCRPEEIGEVETEGTILENIEPEGATHRQEKIVPLAGQSTTGQVGLG